MMLKVIIQIDNICREALTSPYLEKTPLIQKKNISENLAFSRLAHKISKERVEFASENWAAASKHCLSKNQDAANSFGHKYFVGVRGGLSQVLLSQAISSCTQHIFPQVTTITLHSYIAIYFSYLRIFFFLVVRKN